MQMPDPPRAQIERAIRNRETNSAHALALAQEAEEVINRRLEERGRESPLTNIARAMTAIEPSLSEADAEAHAEGGRGWNAAPDAQVLDVLDRVFVGCDQLGWGLTRPLSDFRAEHRL